MIIVLIIACAALVAGSLYTQRAQHPPQEGVYKGSTLPEKRPSDFRISYSFNAGMTGQGSALFLSEKESNTTQYSLGNQQKTDFTVTPQELDELYAIFRNNHFEKITWQSEMVYDGAGGALTIGWETTNINKRIGDGVIMSEQSQKIMDTVTAAVQKFVASKLATLSTTLTIEAGSGIVDSRLLSVRFDSSPHAMVFNGKRIITIDILPGNHLVAASLTSVDTKLLYTLNEEITIPNKPTTLNFFISKQQLRYTLR